MIKAMRNLPIEPSTKEIQPWHSLGGLEHICELRKSCTVLYGIFTELARMIWADKDGRLIGTPSVVWSKTKPGIWIDTELRWEDEHPEFRPAIYIQLGQQQRQDIIPGFNGKLIGANRFAERHYEQKVSGQVTFMHVAATSGMACSLADNTEYALTLMQDPIKDDFCFYGFEAAGRVPLTKLQDESKDRYGSGVMFNYEFVDAWNTKEECPILKTVTILNRQETVSRDNIFTEAKVSDN